MIIGQPFYKSVAQKAIILVGLWGCPRYADGLSGWLITANRIKVKRWLISGRSLPSPPKLWVFITVWHGATLSKFSPGPAFEKASI
ncbi:MAG: hypothetical protein CM15mP46_3100 [Alphaproteobacteria bacterium]|nr:MAG: hypothetical protein CM15mP46_3100 [Alphaproteobacteria bacterium]